MEKDEIDHSTLMALLLYSNIDKEEPEFFIYLKKTIENLEKKHAQTNQNISKQEFIRLFTEPDISYQNLKIDEMASVFFLLRIYLMDFSFSKFSIKTKEDLSQQMISYIFIGNLRNLKIDHIQNRKAWKLKFARILKRFQSQKKSPQSNFIKY